ncbi:MAG: hypothetical protein ABH869_04410 [Candidatus Omnitrophota bacterium]
MVCKRSFLYRVGVFFISFVFLLSNISYSLDFSSNKLSPVWASINKLNQLLESDLSQKFDFSASGLEQSREFMQTMSVAVILSELLLKKNVKQRELKNELKNKFLHEKARKILKRNFIDLDSIQVKDGIVSFLLKTEEGKQVVISVCEKENKPDQLGWHDMDEYAFLVITEPEEPEQSTDLEGSNAGDADPLLRNFIEKDRMIELWLDSKADSLKAKKVVWVDNYRPLITPSELYLGEDVDLNQYFTGLHQKRLKKLIKEEKGDPIKFRVILGETSIGWKDDVDHANIAHAGVRDRAVYIGGLFLKNILSSKGENLEEEILKKDEFRHIQGLDHGDEKDVKKRLKLAKENIAPLEKFKNAILNNNVDFLKVHILSLLLDHTNQFIEGNVEDDLLLFFSICDEIFLSQTEFPVEARYPIKKAVALLSAKYQEQLVDILTGKKAEEYRNQILIDDILAMLDETKQIKDWVKVHAAELKGRTLWEISPEIWHEAGGLARVMQYHGTGIMKLLKDSDVRFKQLEAQYEYRIGANGEPVSLDYTKDLTHSIKPETLEKVFEFKVTVNGKEVDVIVNKGINDLGIEDYLIKDVQPDGHSYYCHSLYNYKDTNDRGKDHLPTWEEFSVFFSKATLEFQRWYAKKEKQEIEAKEEKWKAPVFHTNDSQVALFNVYAKIELNRQLREKENNPSFEIEQVLQEALFAFTTHTYRNRKDYKLEGGYGDKILDLMEIPHEYRELFAHKVNGWQEVYDIASAGLRFSDWQGCVSRAHRNDVEKYDNWVNKSEKRSLKELVKRFLVKVKLIAVTNADNRQETAKYFRKFLREINSDIDVEHPDPKEILEAKKKAKKALRLAENQEFYSTFKSESLDLFNILDENMPVVAYSGRLVPEKAGRQRAFTDENIKRLLRKGVQVVIYGNRQTNDGRSTRLYDDMKRLVYEIKEEQGNGRRYDGRLIFVPRFSLDDQRRLLAATDIIVLDSDKATEACGYTEVDASACGALVLASYRDGVGEGIIKAQGIPIDLAITGIGNTLIPKGENPEDYYEILEKVLNMPIDKRAEYQLTSLKLSRILEATATSGEYLRQFSQAIARKKAFLAGEQKKREIKEMQEKKRSLYEQVFLPDEQKEPKNYAVNRIIEYVLDGKQKQAIKYLFTTDVFQARDENLDVVCSLLNNLSHISKDEKNRENTKDFIMLLIKSIVELTGNDEESIKVAKAVQIMSAQSLNIMSWIDNKFKGADQIRLTINERLMVSSERDEKGKSFIYSTSLPDYIKEGNTEGKAGFFWRGVEDVAKLEGNIPEELMYDKETFLANSKKLLMYIMTHGFIKVPDKLKEATEKGEISTIHDTSFLHDFLPGSYQAVSTGDGHFQGDKLDIKYVTEGRGIQFNVLCDEKGNITEVLAQRIKAGDWFVALPCYKEYIINLGGLRFNDISVKCTDEQIGDFMKCQKGDWRNADYRRQIAKASEKIKAPYIGIKHAKGEELVRTLNDIRLKWFENDFSAGMGRLWTLADCYKAGFNGRSISDIVDIFKEEFLKAKTQLQGYMIQNPEQMLTSLKQIKENMIAAELITLNKTAGIKEYIDNNMVFFSECLKDPATTKLIRIPIELIKSTGPENVKILGDIFKKHDIYLELFSADDKYLSIPESTYDEYGLEYGRLARISKDRRHKGNTITLMPVYKGDEFGTGGHKEKHEWLVGDMEPEHTIIVPVANNFDRTGIVRSIILGLRLSEIADGNYKEDGTFVAYTLGMYLRLCLALGQDMKDIDFTTNDIWNMARGNLSQMVQALNKYIRTIPIVPFNTEEVREVYEYAREALIRA